MAQSSLEVLTTSVDALTSEIQSLRAETQGLSAYGRRSRFLIRLQWLIGAFVVIMAITIGYVAVGARHTAQVSQHNSVNQYDACVTGNKARATTRDLWNYLLASPPLQPLTPQQEAAREALIASFRSRVATAYADQDCSKLGK